MNICGFAQTFSQNTPLIDRSHETAVQLMVS